MLLPPFFVVEFDIAASARPLDTVVCWARASYASAQEGTIAGHLKVVVGEAASPAEAVGARACDGPELAALYRRYWNEICAYLRRRFGPGPPEPEDIAQAAFMRITARAELPRVENPRAFIYRVAFNLAVEERRKLVARSRTEAELLPFAGDETDDRDPERVLSGKERRQLLELAFASLEPRARQIVIMSRQEELSSAEIARRLGLSPTHVKRLMAEAIAHCRAVVEAEQMTDGAP